MDAVSVALINKLAKSSIPEEVHIALALATEEFGRRNFDFFTISDSHEATGHFLYYVTGKSFSAHRTLKTISEVANSETAMNIVANSETAMNIVANSETAMNAVANSETAMNIVANSETAMNAVANSSTARSACLNSTTGRTFYLGSPYALSLIWADTTRSNEVWNKFGNISAVTKKTPSPAGGTYVEKSGTNFDVTITISIDWTYVTRLSFLRYASDILSTLGVDVYIGNTQIGSLRGFRWWQPTTLDVSSYTGVQTLKLRLYNSSATNNTAAVGDITLTLAS